MHIITTEGDQFKPEGIATDEDIQTDEQAARILFYRSSVTGSQGARYELLKEKHHTRQDVEKAKQYIRRNFDPVNITILKEKV